ncbi:MAG: tail fiber protein [Pseudomonadota bacterium]
MKKTLAAAALAAASLGAPEPAAAQDLYIGQIIMGGWSFCPRGTVATDGQLLPISQYQALFSLLGTQFGGDGRTTFGLPDLRGRIAMHTGTGAGLSPRREGAKGGAEIVTLTTQNLPAHSHTATGTPTATVTPGSNPNPAGNLPALTTSAPAYAAPGGATADMAAGSVSVSVGSAGGNQSFGVMNPYQVIRYCIALQGIYPSRN